MKPRLLLLAVWLGCPGVASAADLDEGAPPPLVAPVPVAPAPRPAGKLRAGDRLMVLECANIRRLDDGFALDRRIRFEFRRSSRSYERFDNLGRGWHPSGTHGPISVDKAHVTLIHTPEILSYLERYTGDYYYIDRLAPERSLWGRCNWSGRLMPLF